MKSIIANIKTVRNSAFEFATAFRHSPKVQYHTVSALSHTFLTAAMLSQSKRIQESGPVARICAGALVPTFGIFAVDDIAKIKLSVDEYHREKSKVETTETN